MGIKRYVTYVGIAAVSLTVGAIEGVYDTPCIFKTLLGIVPLTSASIGAANEHREEYGPDLGVSSGIGEGLAHVLTIASGIGAGGGLSALCEAAGFGLGKLLSR